MKSAMLSVEISLSTTRSRLSLSLMKVISNQCKGFHEKSHSSSNGINVNLKDCFTGGEAKDERGRILYRHFFVILTTHARCYF